MRTIKGPAIFLAQFAGDEAPFNSLDSIAAWVSGLGFKGVQMPSWDGRLFDLEQAAESKAYCEDILATLDHHGLPLAELSTHLQGQLVAVHPAYDAMFDGFADPSVRGNPSARQAWAVDQLMKAAREHGQRRIKTMRVRGRRTIKQARAAGRLPELGAAPQDPGVKGAEEAGGGKKSAGG